VRANTHTKETHTRTTNTDTYTKEIDTHAKETNTRTKETYSRTKETNTHTKDINTNTKETYSRTKEAYHHTQAKPDLVVLPIWREIFQRLNATCLYINIYAPPRVRVQTYIRLHIYEYI